MATITEIQKNLREAILTSTIPKKEIAKQLGVNPSTISKYLHCDKFPSIDTFAKLCEILDVSSDEILGLKD
jgi:transcriptional regulator with XRE-family HTH domain